MIGNKPAHRMSSVKTLIGLAEEGISGRHWYHAAKKEVEHAAEILSVAPWEYADYLALFSPRVSVKRNIRLTNYYLVKDKTFHPTTMRPTRVAVDHYNESGEIRGIKTAPFSQALLGVGDAIVLDVWMARALGIEQENLARLATHDRACGRIRLAARSLGWAPAEVQAAVWTSAVRKAGRVPTPFKIVENTVFGPTLESA